MVKASGSPSIPSSIDPAWMEVDLAALASNCHLMTHQDGIGRSRDQGSSTIWCSG